ncbi:TPA: hypothetical protein ACGW5I_005456 [Bacillus cereus]
MTKPILIIVGAAVIWVSSCLLLRKDKDKPTLLNREVYGFWDNEEDDVYEDRVSDITYKAKPKETFEL